MEVLTTDPLARRYAAVTLVHLAQWPLAKVKKVIGAARSALFEWSDKLAANLALTDGREESARKGQTAVSKTDLTALKKLLTSGARATWHPLAAEGLPQAARERSDRSLT